jgi:hemin uptake protein HemP
MTSQPSPRPTHLAPPPSHDDAESGLAKPAEIDLRRLIPPGSNAVAIEHDGQRYTLRLTRSNKLILTK